MSKTANESPVISEEEKIDLSTFERELASKEKVLRLVIASLERAKIVRRKTLESEFSI